MKSIAIVIACLATLGVAHARPLKKVRCKDGDPVFIPKKCDEGYENFVREGGINLHASISKGSPSGELSAETRVVELATDPVVEMIQTHYIHACNAQRTAPCDLETRQEMRRAEKDIRELSIELMKIRASATYSPHEQVDLVAAVLNDDDSQAGFRQRFDAWLDTQKAREGFGGEWTVSSTPSEKAFVMSSREDETAASSLPCPTRGAQVVTSIWTIETHEGGAVDVSTSFTIPGQRQTDYPRMEGKLVDRTLVLRESPVVESGGVDGRVRAEIVLLPGGKFSGLRRVFARGCVSHWLIEGER